MPLRRGRLGLGTLLAGNVAIVLGAVLGVVVVALGGLERLGGERALARVTPAAESALAAIERAQGDAAIAARLLADEPSLRRIIETADAPGLARLLEQSTSPGRFDGCVVIARGRVLARAGADLDLERAAGRERSIAPRAAGDSLLVTASAPVAGVPSTEVVVGVSLDEAFAARIGASIGIPVAVVGRRVALGPGAGPRAVLRARALATEAPAAGRIDPADLYVAVRPLRAPSGEIVGFVEAALPAGGSDASVRALTWNVVLMSLGLAALAAVASVLLARRFVGPIEALAGAALRIGEGDLTTPVPLATGAPEIGMLTATMEEMRVRLLSLTAELRRRQGEAEAVLGGIVEGVFAVDRERRIRYVNPGAAASLRIEPEQALGRFCGDVLKPEGPGGVRPCEDHCPIVHARLGAGARATEHLRLASGERRTVVIASAPPLEDRQVQVLRDETDVEAARRLRDSVLANFSHEFRTPLSAQIASIELLEARLPETTPEEVRGLVRSLQRGTLRLTHLVDNLLESASVEAGRGSIRKKPVALDEVVEEAAELMAPLLEQRRQRLALELPHPLPAITGDHPRLVQVFVNLLANANKFAPEGSAITIGGEAAPGSTRLWVEDEGPGLSAGEGGPFFERFFRALGEEPEASGVGLGLWIAKSIVERHGGKIEAARGKVGARVSITLFAGSGP